MSTAVMLFGCTFVAVFALGLQSLNVNQGHHLAASFTSVAISIASIYLYKTMPGSDPVEIGGYMFGAICGINASMWFHRRAKAWISLQRARWQARRAVDRRPDEHRDVEHCGRMGDGYQPRRMGGTDVPSTPPRFP